MAIGTDKNGITRDLGGRPIKYTPELIKEICQKMIKFADTHEAPTLARFCYENKIPKSMIKSIDGFSDAVMYLMSKQEADLTEGGLQKRYSDRIASLMLFNHGYANKTDQNITANVTLEDKLKKVGDDDLKAEIERLKKQAM